jgi:predicted glycoside hydrolase/deacetylase ChbG (UPF0249 family)
LRVDLDDPDSIKGEIDRQVDRFRQIVGREPSHIDSHQHVHLRREVLPYAVSLARDLAVPLRQKTAQVRYCGTFYGQTGEGSPIPHALEVTSLEAILEGLPEGINELACHPGYATDLDTTYKEERSQEVSALCAPEITSAAQRSSLRLVSFADLTDAGWHPEIISS